MQIVFMFIVVIVLLIVILIGLVTIDDKVDKIIEGDTPIHRELYQRMGEQAFNKKLEDVHVNMMLNDISNEVTIRGRQLQDMSKNLSKHQQDLRTQTNRLLEKSLEKSIVSEDHFNQLIQTMDKQETIMRKIKYDKN